MSGIWLPCLPAPRGCPLGALVPGKDVLVEVRCTEMGRIWVDQSGPRYRSTVLAAAQQGRSPDTGLHGPWSPGMRVTTVQPTGFPTRVRQRNPRDARQPRTTLEQAHRPGSSSDHTGPVGLYPETAHHTQLRRRIRSALKPRCFALLTAKMLAIPRIKTLTLNRWSLLVAPLLAAHTGFILASVRFPIS